MRTVSSMRPYQALCILSRVEHPIAIARTEFHSSPNSSSIASGGTMTFGERPLPYLRARVFLVGLADGEADGERRALVLAGAGGHDLAVVLADDPVRDRQAQPRPLAHAPLGEERLED